MRKVLLALLAMMFLMGGSASLVATAQDDATPDAEVEDAVETTNLSTPRSAIPSPTTDRMVLKSAPSR